MLVYWLLIGVIFGRGGPDYPLFVLCGLVPFRAFAVSFSQSVSSISGKFALISQVNFPRIYLPLGRVVSNQFRLLFGFIIIFVFTIVFGVPLTFKLIYLIIPYILQLLLSFGLGLMLAILGVYFRDMKNLTMFIMRILIYLSPVLFSIENIPERVRPLYMLNPLASLIVMYRSIIMHQQAPDPQMLLLLTGEVVVIVLLGLVVFHRQDRSILKYI